METWRVVMREKEDPAAGGVGRKPGWKRAKWCSVWCIKYKSSKNRDLCQDEKWFFYGL